VGEEERRESSFVKGEEKKREKTGKKKQLSRLPLTQEKKDLLSTREKKGKPPTRGLIKEKKERRRSSFPEKKIKGGSRESGRPFASSAKKRK